ncbi:MAG: siphovirus Gp157 family protein [Sphingobacteriaceae bacterium]|nr:siphovirus Gp157 family protein [Sphingobacteriaceae bacterium]
MSSIKLHELNQEIEEILSMMNDAIEENDEDTLTACRDTLESMQIDVDMCVSAYVESIKRNQVFSDALKSEIDTLKKRKEVVENKIERQKEFLKQFMLKTEKKKVETATCSVAIRNNAEKLIIEDEEQLIEFLEHNAKWCVDTVKKNKFEQSKALCFSVPFVKKRKHKV